MAFVYDCVGRVPIHVTEYALGFGLRPSSSAAQRFADATMWWLRRRADKGMAGFRAADTDTAHQAFFAERATLGPGQDRLATSRCFTDDPHFADLGVDRPISALRHWGELTVMTRVEVASFEKHQAGSNAAQLDVLCSSVAGTIAAQQAKALKAIGRSHRVPWSPQAHGPSRAHLFF